MSTMISSSIVEEELVMKKRVGYWMSDKKAKRLNFGQFEEICRNSGIELVLLDLDVNLEAQGPLDGILHKASDLIIFGDQGDTESANRVRNISQFLGEHSECVMIDPLPSVRLLCDRYLQYSLLRAVAHEDQVLTPAFTDLTSDDLEENKSRLRKAGVTFPLISKPLVAHGSSFAHEMALIFSEKGLRDVTLPCVAQSFIPHDAVLYKVFVLGDKHFIISRPSVKNLTPGGYDGVPDFFHHLLQHLRHRLKVESEEFVIFDQSATAADKPPLPPRRDSASLPCDDWFLTRGLSSTIHGSAKFPGIARLLQEEKRRRTEQMSKIVEGILDPNQDESTANQGSPKHARSVDDSALRGKSPNDSGVGSCTESDTSDCEKKLKLWKLEAERNKTRHAAAQTVPREPEQAQTSALATESVAAAKKCEFFPDWKRIKKFYGIPKPGGGHHDEGAEENPSTGVSAEENNPELADGQTSLTGNNRSFVVTKRGFSEFLEGEGGKPRAGTIP